MVHLQKAPHHTTYRRSGVAGVKEGQAQKRLKLMTCGRIKSRLSVGAWLKARDRVRGKGKSGKG
eukprot:2280035-Rhodomonas_salina.1